MMVTPSWCLVKFNDERKGTSNVLITGFTTAPSDTFEKLPCRCPRNNQENQDIMHV